MRPNSPPVHVHEQGGSKAVTLNRDPPAGRKWRATALAGPSGPGGVRRARVMWGAQAGQPGTSASPEPQHV